MFLAGLGRCVIPRGGEGPGFKPAAVAGRKQRRSSGTAGTCQASPSGDHRGQVGEVRRRWAQPRGHAGGPQPTEALPPVPAMPGMRRCLRPPVWLGCSQMLGRDSGRRAAGARCCGRRAPTALVSEHGRRMLVPDPDVPRDRDRRPQLPGKSPSCLGAPTGSLGLGGVAGAEEGAGSGAGHAGTGNTVPWCPARRGHGGVGSPPVGRVRPRPTAAAEEQPRSWHLTGPVSRQEPECRRPSVGPRHRVPARRQPGWQHRSGRSPWLPPALPGPPKCPSCPPCPCHPSITAPANSPALPPPETPPVSVRPIRGPHRPPPASHPQPRPLPPSPSP